MVHLENVYFSYGPKTVLQGIDMDLQPGHIYGLLGENAVGKSTLLKCIAGIVFPTSGAIHVHGHNPGLRQRALLQDVFFLPEDFSLPSLPIAHYKDLYASFYPKFDDSGFQRYLDVLRVPYRAHLDHLSHGQKKKVLIAFGLATNTHLLLMDEPTNGLDIPSKSQFRRLMASALSNERSFLISTHQVRDLDNLIDHLIILKDRRIVLSESVEHISKTLCFQLTPDATEDALYSEKTIAGVASVVPNRAGTEEGLDIELFLRRC